MAGRLDRFVAVLAAVGIVAVALWLAAVEHHARRVADRHPGALSTYAHDVASHALSDPTPGWSTGSDRFDGEWAVVTCQMTVLGLGQLALADPSAVDPRWLAAMDACAARLADPASQAFGTAAWGASGFDRPAGDHAYLGYTALGARSA